MEIEKLGQKRFNTTLMGVLGGVADYYGIEVSDAMLFGGSGHAFVINIHQELCPSGPYCWNNKVFHRLVANLGIEIIDHGFYSADSSAQNRLKLEAILIDWLDKETPCALLNMENQLITGYDGTGFLTAQPWAPKVDFPPAHLTFSSWDEFGDECHVNFYSFHRTEPLDRREAIQVSLRYAVDLFDNPTAHTRPPYGIGPDAYANFIGAIKAGHGASHGNWWNATVWAECRQMAAAYFAEIADGYEELAPIARTLSDRYAAVAKGLSEASDKAMDDAAKISLLERTCEEEKGCLQQVEELAAAMRE